MREQGTPQGGVGRERFSAATLSARTHPALVAVIVAWPCIAAPRASFALDPAKAILQYHQAAWTVEQGLSQNNAHAVVRDREGYLWIGTESGLSRFDGVSFTRVASSDATGILNNSTWVLCLTRDGDLWIGTEGGLVRRKDGAFRSYTAADGLPGTVIHALHEDPSGVLWIGTADGLVRFSNEAFTRVKGPEALRTDRIRAIFTARDGTFWVGTDTRGLYRMKDGVWSAFTTKDGLPMNRVWCIQDDREGNVWVGTYGGGLSRLRDGTFTTYTPEDGLANRFVYTMLEDRHGNLWIGTDKGLSRWRGGRFETATSADGLAHDKVWGLYEDPEGNLWIGTRGGGLIRLSDGRITTWGKRQGLVGQNMFSVTEDSEGAIWGAALGGGVVRLKGDQVENFTAQHGLVEADRIWTVFADSRGRVWAGGDAGLFRLEGRRFRWAQRTRDVRAIWEDRSGRLWIGTFGHGLHRLEDDRLVKTLTTKDGLPNDYVIALLEDREGTLWIGTWGGGLARFKDGSFRIFSLKDGLASDSVRVLYEDREGTLWAGTTGGLCRFDGERITRYTMREGLYDDLIFQIFEDGEGDFWLGSARGIFEISRKHLDDAARGVKGEVRATVYGKVDGLESASCLGATTPSGWKSRDGRLWFPTQGGLAVARPDWPVPVIAPVPVVIERVAADRTSYATTPAPELPAGTREVQVHYTGLSFRAPEKVRFRYRLEPFDRDWVEAGSRRTAYYTNLPPDRYRFSVSARNEAGVWTSEVATLQIVLRPFFYQTQWFFALCVLATVSAALGLYAMRVRSLKERERVLAARVEEALSQVKILSGLLPICAECKKIRDDKGYWSQLEVFIHDHSQAEFSHGLCPDCASRLFPGLVRPSDARAPGAG